MHEVLELAHVARPRLEPRATPPPRRDALRRPAERRLSPARNRRRAAPRRRAARGAAAARMAITRAEERSSRKRRVRDARSRSRFVAATIRTSTCRSAWLPSGRNVWSCEDAQQLGLQRRRSSPISSRNRVPPCACLEQAGLRARRAGEGAALVAEELALEQRLGNGAAVDATNGRSRRGLRSWIARATSSLPVPVSPSMTTGTSNWATRSMSARASRKVGNRPTSHCDASMPVPSHHRDASPREQRTRRGSV